MPRVSQKSEDDDKADAKTILMKPTPSTASGSTTKTAARSSRRKPTLTVKNAGRRRRIGQAERLRRQVVREIKMAGLRPQNRAIRALPLRKLVKEIAHALPNAQHIRFQASAMEALHEASEAYLVKLFKHTELIANRCKHQTIFPEDMTLARTIAEHPSDVGGKRTMSWVEKDVLQWEQLQKDKKIAEFAEKAAQLPPNSKATKTKDIVLEKPKPESISALATALPAVSEDDESMSDDDGEDDDDEFESFDEYVSESEDEEEEDEEDEPTI